MQLKSSGELRKIRQFRNMTTEDRFEQAERARIDRDNKKNAHNNAMVRLINSRSAEHRALVRDESFYLRRDPSFPKNSTEAKFQQEANRRASLVLRYDHSYEYSKYYDEEIHAIRNGFTSLSDFRAKKIQESARERKEKRQQNIKFRAATSFVAASIVGMIAIGIQTFISSDKRGDLASTNGADPEFRILIGPLNVDRVVTGLATSVDGFSLSTAEEMAEHGNVSAYSSDLPAVRNDHSGERKAIPSDPTKRCPEFEDMFEQYGMFPIETWSYIAWRESRCNPRSQNAEWDENGNMTYHLNKNKTYDTGLLQINSGWRSVTRDICGDQAVENYMQGLKDPRCNILVARYIMEHSAGGLSNWRM